MIEVGQLRRWSWKKPPVPASWMGKVFLIVEERPLWIDKEGVRHSDWTLVIDGQVETHWRSEDIEMMSVVVR